MKPASNVASEKNQTNQNSAVKYKNSTMNSLQNLKIASSNLKNEIEKMLNSKPAKTPPENPIKVAKIQLNRTNDNSEVVFENSLESRNKKEFSQFLFTVNK